MREYCVSMPGVEDVTDGSVDSFEIDWVREENPACPTSCCGSQSRCRCAGCGGCGRCSCNSSRCSRSSSRCSCAGSAGAAQPSAVDWEEYEIVDE